MQGKMLAFRMVFREPYRTSRVRDDLARVGSEGDVDAPEMLAPAIRGDNENFLSVEVLDDRRVGSLRVPGFASQWGVAVTSDDEMDVPARRE